MSERQPPRVAMLLLRWLAPKGVRAEMAGDVAERHAAIAGNRGGAEADRWVWRQVLTLRPLALRSALRSSRRTSGGSVGGSRPRNLGSGWWQDLRMGLRAFITRPAAAFTVVATVALAVGATTAVFSVVHGVLLSPLPYPESDRLARIHQTNDAWADSPNSLLRAFAHSFPASVPTVRDWESADTGFESIGAFTERGIVLQGPEGAESVRAYGTTAGLFATLEISPMVGRGLEPSDDRPGAPRVVVLSEGFWRDRFAADPEAIGREMIINGSPHTVVGVMPARFDPPTGTARFWLPLSEEQKVGPRDSQFLSVVGRLLPGVSLEEASARMAAVQHRLAEEQSDGQGGYGSRVESLIDSIAGDIRTTLLFLLGAVGLVLLIASLNIANLLSVLGLQRRRELAVKVALGAGSGRLVRGLAVESAVMAGLGGLLGILIAWAAQPVLLRLVPPSVPRYDSIAMSGAVVAFGAGVTVLTAIVVGALPALQAARTSPREMLAGSGRALAGDRSGNRVRGGLVVVEVALAFLLLVGAGLLGTSFMRLSAREPGFSTESLLSVWVTPDPEVYPEATDRRRFLRELRAELDAFPGVVATATNQVPLAGSSSSTSIEVDREEAEPGEANVLISVVLENYFEVMEIPLRRGRALEPTDVEGTPRVGVVNETLAASIWPGESPIGKRLRFRADEPWLTVVGVVGDVLHKGLAGDPDGKLYVTAWQNQRYPDQWALRTTGDPGPVLDRVREVVAAISPSTPLGGTQILRERISETLAVPRFRALFVVGLAAMAGVLALLGVFSVVMLSVSQRTREIGVRVALGARSGAVVRHVVWGGLRLGICGVVAGALLALPAVRWLQEFLFATEPTDPTTWIAIAAGVLGVSMAASLVPARRAAAVDPIQVLSEG